MRRIGCVVLVRDPEGRVLLVKPTYKPGWILPGGGAHESEQISDAAHRELWEETGLRRPITHFVALDQVPADPQTGVAEGFNVVCDGGTLSAQEAEAVSLPVSGAKELHELRWVPLDQLSQYAEPYQTRRILEAAAALSHGTRLPLLLLGEPAG